MNLPGSELAQQGPPVAVRDPFWDWHDAALFLALVLPCLLLALVLSRGLFLLLPSPPGEAARAFTFQLLGYVFWFGALWLLLRTRYARPFWPSLGWRVPWKGFGWTLVLGPLLAFAVILLGLLLRTPAVDNPIERLMKDRQSALLVGLFAITLGPLAEELVFRGFFLPLAIRSAGLLGGILLTNVPFALLHGPQYRWTWQHLLLLFVASSAFCWTRLKTGSTAASTLVHGCYNSTFFAAMVLQGRNS